MVEEQAIGLRPATGPEEWAALLDRDARATPFHEWDLLRGVASRSGARFDPLVVADGSRAIGVLPVVSAGRLGVTPDLFLPYSSPLVPPEALPATLRAMRRWQLRHGRLRVRLGFDPQQPALLAGLGRGATTSADRTYVLDLADGDVEAYVRRMHTDRRANLRKAMRRGVSSRPSRAGEASTLLPRVVGRGFARHDAPEPASVAAVASYVDAELEKAAGTSTPVIAQTVFQDDDPIGLLVAAMHSASAFGFIGGVVPEALHSNASTVAYDGVIRRAMAAGVKRFDFVGHVDDGVARFKRSFGAVEASTWQLTSDVLPDAVTRFRSVVARRRNRT